MWKDYSKAYIKNNRFAGLSLRIAAFLSALLLSLLCCLFYNLWKYEIERIHLEVGDWQSRIVGELSREELEAVRSFATLREAVVNPAEAGDQETTVDLYFQDMRSVFSDTPKLVKLAGLSMERVDYNYELLAMYLIRSAQDPSPRLVFPLFLLITGMASLSLIIIIHSSFAVSMKGRIHQLGILSSVGATPRQLRACLLQEAAALCALPVLTGVLLGIGAGAGLLRLSNLLLGEGVSGRHEAVFGYHPLIFGLTLLVTGLTVWISAWMPARRLSKITPLEALKNTEEPALRRGKKSPVLARVFGIEGELAGGALRSQRRALRTASLSLSLSFLAFTLTQCFFTLSGISTRETYFERYQEVWDIMVTVKNASVESFEEAERIRELEGAENVIVYQRAAAKTLLSEEAVSGEMKAFGGFSQAPGQYVTRESGGWLVNAPLVILDDASFLAYCEQIGALPDLEGAVLLNRIRDVTNPDFRHPEYLPYVKEERKTSVLRRSGGEETAEIPVLAYTFQAPALREEYGTVDYYELVHFLPASLWEKIREQIGGFEGEMYLCVKGKENVTREELSALQKEIDSRLRGTYTAESENRIQEYEENNRQIRGMMAVLGGFCMLLAMIGIGNVFSHTLGFVRQRRREFARYLSVGLTPGQIRKLFFIEGLVVAGRPVLITLPLAVLAVGAMLKASYVDPGEFLAQAPLAPVGVFLLAIWGAVALAYSLGWRNLGKIHLIQVLRDDTML